MLPVYVGDPVDINNEENSKLRRYAETLRARPSVASMAGKRKSGAASSEPKSKAASAKKEKKDLLALSASDIKKEEHLRLNETIKMSGSLDAYLAKQLDKKELPSTHLPKPPANQSVQDLAIEIYKFIDEQFPAEPGDVLRMLAMNILYRGFMSDPNIPGNEKALQNASAFASAYQIGKLEAGACSNLLNQESDVKMEKAAKPPGKSWLLICDMFAEWSHACLEMQLEELTNASYSGPAMHYMGIFLEDDSSMARSLESLVAGKLMSGWLPDLVRNKYGTSHAANVKKIDEIVSQEKDIATALTTQASESATTPATSASGEPSVVPSRTLAAPEFDGQPVPNFERVVDFEQKSLEDFNNTHALLGESNLNLDVICVVATDATGATVKKLTTVCEAICDLIRHRGVVEASMIDYDLQPMTKVVGANNETRALQFRYTVAARAKVNAFRPKVIDENLMDVRYSQFGGCFDDYSDLLQSPNAKIAWEAH
eukprot:s2116_g13.t1